MKRWDWLVPIMILALLLPGCPTQTPKVAEATDGGWLEIPRYEHEIYPGELEDPSEKATGINFLADFYYGVSVENEFLDARSERLGNGNYTMLDGMIVHSGTIFYLIPGAVLAKNGEEIEDVRIVEFYRKTWQRNGPSWPYLTISEADVYDGVVKYKKDKPDKPVVDGDHNGDGILSRFFGALRRIGSVFINLWFKKNVFELVACYSFNHTVGLAGWGILPAWCVNGPLKKGDDQKAGDYLGFKGALEFPIDPGVVKYQYGATIEIRYKKKPVEAKHITGIIAMDSDGDGIPDDWEIDHGTNPDDPNDPGNPTTDTYVPCPPDGVYWSLNQVDDALQTAGLSRLGNPIYENFNTVPENKFLHYDKPCGATVPKGTALKVYLSAGPLDNGEVEIPCVIGMYEESEAIPTLHAAGFTNLMRIVVYGPEDEGWRPEFANLPCWQLGWQWPECGESATTDTQVKYWVKGCIEVDDLMVTIDSPADNFVGVVGQPINFSSTTTGGVTPYDDHHWHFPDNDHRYTYEDRVKTFDFPGAGWAYKYVTDAEGTVAQDRVWIQINAASKTYRGKISWMGQWYEYGSWPYEARLALGL